MLIRRTEGTWNRNGLVWSKFSLEVFPVFGFNDVVEFWRSSSISNGPLNSFSSCFYLIFLSMNLVTYFVSRVLIKYMFVESVFNFLFLVIVRSWTILYNRVTSGCWGLVCNSKSVVLDWRVFSVVHWKCFQRRIQMG